MAGSAIQNLSSIDEDIDKDLLKEIVSRKTTVVVNKLARDLLGIAKMDLSKKYSFRQLPVHDVLKLPGSRIKQSFVPIACAVWDDSSDSDEEIGEMSPHKKIQRSVSEPNMLLWTLERHNIFEGEVHLPHILPEER